MVVVVKYFGMIAEITGKADEEINFESSDSTINLSDYFNSRYTQLKSITYKVAIDQEFKNDLEMNSTVSEIALLPPFAGG